MIFWLGSNGFASYAFWSYALHGPVETPATSSPFSAGGSGPIGSVSPRLPPVPDMAFIRQQWEDEEALLLILLADSV